jgi:hypothetical protein
MRYLAALSIAIGIAFFLFWAGARIAQIVSGPERVANEFTVGQRFDLCGYQVDSRFAIAGYALDDWQADRCKDMSDLDHCVLGCLQGAGTVEIAASCYEDCVRGR